MNIQDFILSKLKEMVYSMNFNTLIKETLSEKVMMNYDWFRVTVRVERV